MSANGDDDDGAPDSGPGRREVAYRLFATEFDDADFSYSESDEERAPNYVVTPTGARANRLFAVGVLTEVEPVNEGVVRGRVVDPTGAFVTYAGQYQPDALAFLERASPPAFVALTGKARTFQPDDSDRTFTSVRPESATEVDAATRDRWTVTAAEATLRRIAYVAAARSMPEEGEALRIALLERGAPESLAAGIPLALDHYGTTEGYLEALRRVAVDTLEQVAGERDEVRSLDVAPDDPTGESLGSLPALDDPAPTGADGSPAGGASTSDAGADVDADADASADADAGATATTAEASPPPDDGGEDGAAGSGGPGVSLDDDPAPADGSAADPAGTTTTSTADASDDGVGGFDDPDDTSEVGSFEDPVAGDDGGGLGGFDDPGGASTGDADDADDVDPEPAGDPGEMYELDDDERREVEEEFGTGFETGNTVDDPGEADIEVPSAEELDEVDVDAGSGAGAGTADDVGPGSVDAAGTEGAGAASSVDAADAGSVEADPSTGDADATAGTGTDGAATDTDDAVGDTDADDGAAESVDAEDVDLQTAAVDLMSELDDGDGAPRDAVVAELTDRYGADPDAADDAIQDALMSGQCYEPGDGTLKAI